MYIRTAAYEPDAFTECAAAARRPSLNDILAHRDSPVASFSETPTSGWLAVELDAATADPAGLSDDEVVEGIVGFDRMVGWAQARQSALLAEFARRRPADLAATPRAVGG